MVANEERANGYYEVVSPKTGKVFNVPKGKHWVYSQENMMKLIEENGVWFGKDGNSFPRKKRFLANVMNGRKGDTWWSSDEVGHNQEAKRESIKIFGKHNAFATPKPERLVERILQLATDEGDLVLDSFLGSATTVAVAHKMKRRWIGIEMGEHVITHCKYRMDLVIDGEDGGVSKNNNWQGGGGYKFYELAEPLLVKNKVLPVYQINPSYTWDMVCEAICKIEGFTYEPSSEFQGHSSENRFIHITEEFVNTKYVMSIMKNLGDKQSLLIYCKKNQAGMMPPDNVEVKKIPRDLLDKCNFESEVQE